ncbi:MAG TPA: hypothetical protein VGP90_05130 [Acidimicrobiia bacterium]|nr:hypothetical protein [Acidimicrobiia bacterium]
MFTGIPAAAQPGGRAVNRGLRLLVVAGLVALVVAWSEASNTVQVSNQVDWAPLGLAGVAAVTGALLGSVLVARQAVAIRLHRLAPFMAGPEESAEAAPPAAVPDAGAAAGAEPLVAGANMARYHRDSCPLTVGKPVRPESRRAHEAAGRRACGVCAP